MSPETMSQRELKRESANIASLGSVMNHMRPYNHAGRYGVEYYHLYSEIPTSDFCYDYSEYSTTSNLNTPIKTKRENLFTRIKRSMTLFKTKESSGSGNDPELPNKGGDGTGGGKAVGGSCGGSSIGEGGGDGKASNINGGDNSGGGKALDFNSDSIMKNTSEDRLGIITNGGGDGGGGKAPNNIGGDNSGGGKALGFNTDSIMKNISEDRLGIITNGGDMGGGGLKDNSIA